MLPDVVKGFLAVTLASAFLIYTIGIYADLPAPAGVQDPAVDRGRMVWQANNCAACHQIYGLGGYLGPDLTNVYDRRDKAFIRQFLRTGTPTMPAYALDAQEVDDLLGFLAHVSATGRSDPRAFIIRYDGTIVQP